MASVVKTIFEQMGGKRFLVMTGSEVYGLGDDTLVIKLKRNKSKANRLDIIYDFGSDLYRMKFIKQTNSRLNLKTGKFTPAKFEVLKELEDVFFDQLQEIFTQVTGFYIKLF